MGIRADQCVSWTFHEHNRTGVAVGSSLASEVGAAIDCYLCLIAEHIYPGWGATSTEGCVGDVHGGRLYKQSPSCTCGGAILEEGVGYRQHRRVDADRTAIPKHAVIDKVHGREHGVDARDRQCSTTNGRNRRS